MFLVPNLFPSIVLSLFRSSWSYCNVCVQCLRCNFHIKWFSVCVNRQLPFAQNRNTSSCGGQARQKAHMRHNNRCIEIFHHLFNWSWANTHTRSCTHIHSLIADYDNDWFGHLILIWLNVCVCTFFKIYYEIFWILHSRKMVVKQFSWNSVKMNVWTNLIY